jgi:hypothetical protein
MISFDDVIAVLLSEMASSGHQLIEHPRIGPMLCPSSPHSGRCRDR